jgi:hypothetical protein
MMALVLLIALLRKQKKWQVHLEESENINEKHNYPFWVRVMIVFLVNIAIYSSWNFKKGNLPVSLSVRPSIYCSTVLLLDFGRFFSFLILYTVGRTPWRGDQPVARPLRTHRTTQTQYKRTQTSMPWVGFEHNIPAFGWAKTVHALESAPTVIG